MNTKVTNKIIAILVARMGSSRIPGKSILNINGNPLLKIILQNLLDIKGIDKLIVATSYLKEDDIIEKISKESKVECFRGDSENVLDRVFLAAKKYSADIIVEVGGDCPFIGADILDPAIEFFLKKNFDYLCNYEPPTYPEGFDINIIKIEALEKAYKNAFAPSQRVHPFSYLSFHREEFKIGNINYNNFDLSNFHWSLDFPEDIKFVQKVYEKLCNQKPSIEKILNLINEDKDLLDLHNKLLRPQVEHSFWNAPSIIKDMNDDISYLVTLGKKSIQLKDFSKANHIYSEIKIICNELKAYSECMLKNSF